MDKTNSYARQTERDAILARRKQLQKHDILLKTHVRFHFATIRALTPMLVTELKPGVAGD